MHSRTLLCTMALIVAAGAVRTAQAQPAVATVAAMVGTMDLQRGPGGASQAAAIGTPIFAGDVIRTGPDGVAKLLFTDDSVLNIGPATELKLERRGGSKVARVSSLRVAVSASAVVPAPARFRHPICSSSTTSELPLVPPSPRGIGVAWFRRA